MRRPERPPVKPNSSSQFLLPTWADAARQTDFERWLGGLGIEHGLRPSSLRVASADASFRRYLRIECTLPGIGSRIIMDAPPDKEDCKPFAKVAALTAQAGLQAPEILAWDEPNGFMLLSDLGQDTLMQHIQSTTTPLGDSFYPQDAPTLAVQALFGQAIDVLVKWQLASRRGVLPAYDEALLRRELALFPDWYLTQHKGVSIDATLRDTLSSLFDTIVTRNLAAPQVYVHRDYMPRNLMMPVTQGAQLGVLDFQDAVYGPISYDIASLMRDAFWTWDEPYVLDVTVRYWQQARKAGLMDFEDWHQDFGAFYRAVEWMGLQRHLKVAGIFARLTLRDGKPKYLADTPRFIQYLRSTSARYRELTPLLRMLDKVENTQAVTGYAFGRV
ncbi:MAG: phosphotransferase [Hylemonella sp.]|nr:phosphotransferase [Hylemonella sp.]